MAQRWALRAGTGIDRPIPCIKAIYTQGPLNSKANKMRWFLGTLIALVAGIGIYVASALVSLNGLVTAARAGDGAQVLERTDLARLRHSLVDQIVSAYLKQLGLNRPIRPVERIAANTYGASVADAMIAKMLTKENLTRILNSGTISSGETTFANMERLSEIDSSRVFEVLSRLSPVKPVEFFFRLGETESAGGVSIHFEGNGWKLSGIQLPASAAQVLAQSLIDNKGRKG